MLQDESLEHNPLQRVVHEMIRERQENDMLRRIWDKMEKDESGNIKLEEFAGLYKESHRGLTSEQVHQLVQEMGIASNGLLTFDEFVRVSNIREVEILRKLQMAPRDSHGFLQALPTEEQYFGQSLQKLVDSTKVGAFAMSRSQHFAMELYESRIASLERFVTMCVIFHQMGNRVQRFFSTYSLGLLGYRMDRTHSIMRIATTASPVGSAHIRERIEALALRTKIQNSIRTISTAWLRYEQRKPDRKQHNEYLRCRSNWPIEV
jgi:hypothetical protein